MHNERHGHLYTVKDMTIYAQWKTWPFMHSERHGHLCTVKDMAIYAQWKTIALQQAIGLNKTILYLVSLRVEINLKFKMHNLEYLLICNFKEEINLI